MKSYRDSKLELPLVSKEPEIAAGYPEGKQIGAWPKTPPAAGATREEKAEAGVP